MVASDGVPSDKSLSHPPPLEAVSRVSRVNPNDHAAILLASQARARAERPSLFAPSSSLWTLKESPSPMPTQLGKERWACTLSEVPPDTLCSSPVASFRFSITPQEGQQLSEAPSSGLKRRRSSYSFFLLFFRRKRCRPIPPSPPGVSRCKSAASSPHLRQLSSVDHYHYLRRISVTKHGSFLWTDTLPTHDISHK